MADEFDCDVCNDTGYVCEECGNADGECACDDGPDLVRCPEGHDDAERFRMQYHGDWEVPRAPLKG